MISDFISIPNYSVNPTHRCIINEIVDMIISNKMCTCSIVIYALVIQRPWFVKHSNIHTCPNTPLCPTSNNTTSGQNASPNKA